MKYTAVANVNIIHDIDVLSHYLAGSFIYPLSSALSKGEKGITFQENI